MCAESAVCVDTVLQFVTPNGIYHCRQNPTWPTCIHHSQNDPRCISQLLVKLFINSDTTWLKVVFPHLLVFKLTFLNDLKWFVLLHKLYCNHSSVQKSMTFFLLSVCVYLLLFFLLGDMPSWDSYAWF